MDTPTLRSTDGRTVRVEVGPYSFTSADAHAFAFALSRVASSAENAADRHERHVDLLASCALCRYEAGSQPDRLTYDDLEGSLVGCSVHCVVLLAALNLMQWQDRHARRIR